MSKGKVESLKQILATVPESDKKIILNGEHNQSGYSVLSSVIVMQPDNENTIQLIDLLIANGADLAIRDPGESEGSKFLNTPLLNAIAEQKWGVALHLVKRCTKEIIDMQSLAYNAKNTALILAFKKQITPIELIEAMIEKGANPNIQNHSGETALHYAAFMGWQKMILKLLEHNAKPHIKNNSLLTPYDLAISHTIFANGTYKRSYTVFEEKNGMPVMTYRTQPTLNNYRSSIIPGHLNELMSIDFYHRIDNNYPSLNIDLEFIEPRSAKLPIYPLETYTAEIMRRLKSDNYIDNSLIQMLERYSKKCNEQEKAIAEGKVLLQSENPEIDNILVLFNNYIIKNSPAPFQLIELRYEVAIAKHFTEAKDIIQNNKIFERMAPALFQEVKQILNESKPTTQYRLR